MEVKVSVKSLVDKFFKEGSMLHKYVLLSIEKHLTEEVKDMNFEEFAVFINRYRSNYFSTGTWSSLEMVYNTLSINSGSTSLFSILRHPHFLYSGTSQDHTSAYQFDLANDEHWKNDFIIDEILDFNTTEFKNVMQDVMDIEASEIAISIRKKYHISTMLTDAETHKENISNQNIAFKRLKYIFIRKYILSKTIGYNFENTMRYDKLIQNIVKGKVSFYKGVYSDVYNFLLHFGTNSLTNKDVILKEFTRAINEQYNIIITNQARNSKSSRFIKAWVNNVVRFLYSLPDKAFDVMNVELTPMTLLSINLKRISLTFESKISRNDNTFNLGNAFNKNYNIRMSIREDVVSLNSNVGMNSSSKEGIVGKFPRHNKELNVFDKIRRLVNSSISNQI